MSTLTLTEQAAPSTPSAGKAVFYIKADGLLYTKDDAGVESKVNASSITAEIAAAIASFLLTLDKTDVGLGNVDNTSDATKDSAVATLTNKTLTAPLISQATTAGAPAYAMGALYFDTTLNKLRVGGATAWETITSS